MKDRSGDPERFRAAFAASPLDAFREWFRVQQGLREERRDVEARALADDLWELLPSLAFGALEDRARFLHNLAVFLGAPGPAASLPRALALFDEALALWRVESEPDDVARALHNRAGALLNLGVAAAELTEAVALYGRALELRDGAKAVARAVTLHNLGAAHRRLAELDAAAELEHLARSEEALQAALELRLQERLEEGAALSAFHLGLTLRAAFRAGRAAAGPMARAAFHDSAARYAALGKEDEAAVAERLAEEIEPGADC